LVVGSESGYCVRVEHNVYPLTFVSVILHYKKATKLVYLTQS